MREEREREGGRHGDGGVRGFLRLGSGGHHTTIEKGEVTDERNGGGGDAKPAAGWCGGK